VTSLCLVDKCLSFEGTYYVDLQEKNILKNEGKFSSETVVPICNAQAVTLQKTVRVIIKLRS